jgi:CRISPR-associated endonuclease/helicase Cas3
VTIHRDDFVKFFAAVNGGHTPFGWQEKLLDTVLGGRWPDRIAAPTGAGKTSAIDVHVFATALTSATGGPRLPRRLVMVVDRRILVDDQYQRALELAEKLASPEHPLVAEVADVLTALSKPDGQANPDVPALVTARLRGGSVPSRSWRDYPAACAVLCATPDMWGSRLLFRGYGTSGTAAAREAGLLAFDAAVVVDEAHLTRQLLVTARRVAQLAQVAEVPINQLPALQVVEVSATPNGEAKAGSTTVAVDEDDLAEERLAARLTRPKPSSLLPVAGWPQNRQSGKVVAELAQAVIAMRAEVCADTAGGTTGSTVGCYVNTVSMALAVSHALLQKALRVVTVCGQIRPADVDRLRMRYPGILSTRGNPEVDVIVTTQSLEVGADLDLAGIVTELASGSALAQRVGRVNRLGKRESGPVTVIVPDEPVTEKMRSGPYSADELRASHAWVTERAAESLGLAPWALRESPPPSAERRRMLYQRLELADAWHWARTSDDLAAEPELDLWLSDSLEADASTGIVVRDALPAEPADAVEFARDLPPAPWEVFPVPYRTAQTILTQLLGSGKVMVRVRGEDTTLLQAAPSGAADLRPGDLVIIDSSAETFTPAMKHVFSPPVVVPSSSAEDDERDGIDATRRGCADDVLHFQAHPAKGSIRFRLEWSPDHAQVAGFEQGTARLLLDDFAENFEDDTERTRRDSLAKLLGTVRDKVPGALADTVGQVIGLLRGNVKESDVILRRSDDGGVRVVVLDRRRAVADEDLRQVFTPNIDAPVLLRAHQHDVATRATVLGRGLRMPTDMINALRIAGEHHDDGKADRRFQITRLGTKGDGDPLAKSEPGKTTRAVQEHQALGGLPGRWRHEQRSVVDGWADVQAELAVDHELALRLIGTSHGHGRSGFPHSSAELAGPEDTPDWLSLAAELFDTGGWDELIEATQIRYGVWGCAYLEAVLRAADCQVSREGR